MDRMEMPDTNIHSITGYFECIKREKNWDIREFGIVCKYQWFYAHNTYLLDKWIL